jgi:hypothetical protein
MNDVNLLFVSPVSSRKILFFGIIRLAKTAFWAGFFILFQSNSFANFGFGFEGILFTFAGFLLSVFVFTIGALLIYSITNGNPFRKLIVKCITAVIFLPIILTLFINYLNTSDLFLSLELTVNSPLLRFFPVSGWTAYGITSFLTGNITSGIFFFGLNLLLGIFITIYILLSNPDYYEDVLVTTETAYEKKRALSEGNVNTADFSIKKVKVAKTGISGAGASALFSKHLRESFRQNRLGFLNFVSILFIIGAAVFSFFVGSDLQVILQILMWIQILFIGTGRGLKETFSHYIYMIPESSFKKIIWCNMEIMVKTLIESILIFTICGFIIKENPLLIITCILTYTLFSFMLIGINYLSMRFTGANISAGILILIYYLAVLIILIPGLVLAIITGIIIGGNTGLLIGLLVLSLWELIAGLLCFTLSKGVLHNCDMPVVKTNI